MKSLLVFLCAFVLSALAHAENITIKNETYGLKVECDAPYTGWINLWACNDSPVLNVAYLSSVDMETSKGKGAELMSCLTRVMTFLKPAGVKTCENATEIRSRAYDKDHTKFLDIQKPY